MSYILDALKRADRERSRGELPDIDAQPAWTAADDAPARPRRAWWGVAGGLVAGLAIVASWQWLGGRPADGPLPPAPAAMPAPITQMPMPSAVGPAVSALPPAGPSPVAQAPFLPPPAPARPAAQVAAPPPPKPAASAAAAPAPPAASRPRVLAWQDLPEDVRRELPALKLSGAIYSQRPADRLVMIDGQVAREGDSVAPGIVLEQIGPRSATFRYKQIRYELRL